MVTSLFIINIYQDLHDVDGDKEFGIETLSVKLGKERVSKLVSIVFSIILISAFGSWGKFKAIKHSN